LWQKLKLHHWQALNDRCDKVNESKLSDKIAAHEPGDNDRES